jgi:hypothetical protein
MSMVGVPEQPSVVFLGQRGHPALAVGRLEFFLSCADHFVGLVKKQHLDSLVSTVVRDERGELTAVDFAGRVVGNVVDNRESLGQLEVGDQLATVRPQVLE